MSRDLTIRFSAATTSSAPDNFTVSKTTYTSSTLNYVSGNNAYAPGDYTFDVPYSGNGGSDSTVIYTVGIWNTLTSPTSGTTIQSNLPHVGLTSGTTYTVECGVGEILIQSTGLCTSSAHGEATYVNNTGNTIIHHDLTQVTSMNSSGINEAPKITIVAFNSNYPNTAASGDTVTAQVWITGTTYFSGTVTNQIANTDSPTIITDYFEVKFDRTQGGYTPSTFSKSTTFYSFNDGTPFHRGLYTVKMQIATDNISAGHTDSKYGRFTLSNVTCP